MIASLFHTCIFHFQFFPHVTICRISITFILLMCCAFELCKTHFHSVLPICTTSVYYWSEISKVVLTSEQFVWAQTGSTGVTVWYRQDIGPKKNHLWAHQTIWRETETNFPSSTSGRVLIGDRHSVTKNRIQTPEDDFQTCLSKHWTHLESSSFTAGVTEEDQQQMKSALHLLTISFCEHSQSLPAAVGAVASVTVQYQLINSNCFSRACQCSSIKKGRGSW